MHDKRTMSSNDADNRRRSSRMFTRIPVKIRGVNSDGNKFREGCQTIVVNAHGGLLYLNESVEMGAQLQMTNPASDEEQECRVVYLGDTSDKGQRVGLEFLSPAPHFWGVEFSEPAPHARPSSSPSR
ncbi:MAG: PilZ domain-containing protein [Candidatus Acidiferrales bacterium]